MTLYRIAISSHLHTRYYSMRAISKQAVIAVWSNRIRRNEILEVMEG